MADVFISYARADEQRVGEVVAAIEKLGLSVWWDRELEGGDDWAEVSEREIGRAKAVVVV